MRGEHRKVEHEYGPAYCGRCGRRWPCEEADA